MSFIGDIQGQNTQLYPIVTIEPPDTTEIDYWDAMEQCIFLSTNSVSLDHIHSVNSTADSYYNYIYQNRYFKPLLLNIPSIKESIDIESKKFKISHVNLDISNIEYGGQRFTDILSDTSLINWKCSIQFVSPSAKLFSTIYDVNHESWTIMGVNHSFYNAYNTLWWGDNEDFNGEALGMTKMVYQGIIRRISHDDTKVKISLEDLTEQKAHKSLPSESYDDSEHLPKGTRLKPKQMVYGYVDKCPLIKSGKLSDDEYEEDTLTRLDIDYREIQGVTETSFSVGVHGFQSSGVFAADGEDYLGIKSNQVVVNSSWIELLGAAHDEIESSAILRPITGIEIIREAPDPTYYNQTEAVSHDIYYPLNTRGSPNNSGGDLVWPGTGDAIRSDLEDNFELGKTYSYDSDANTGIRIQGYSQNTPQYSHYIQFNLAPMESDLTCSTYLIWKSKANPYGHHGTWLYLFNPQTGDYLYNDIDGSEAYMAWVGDTPIATSNNFNDPPTEGVVNLSNDEYGYQRWITGTRAHDNFSYGEPDSFIVYNQDGTGTSTWNTVNQFNHIKIGSVKSHHNNNPDGDKSHITDIFIQEVHLYQLAIITGLLKRDYYGNISGRVNTFDDHPELYYYSGLHHSHDYNSAEHFLDIIPNHDDVSEYYYNEYMGGWDEFGWQPDTPFEIHEHWHPPVLNLIENPIDIIYDLVRRELGHDAIDEAEYAEAKAQHPDWKFGFTVTKKINSKKLIEDIAKSTKCFPKFKNDGTFGFNTIKDSYTAPAQPGTNSNTDYEKAHLIKESEVISYSFKKSKPEQIVSEVGIMYKKDYAQDSYLKDVFSYIEQEYGYHKFDTFGDGSGWEYYGIDSPEEAYLEFESDYIRNDDTAHKLREFLFEHNYNNHLIFNLKLPLQYINLEIGDLVKFRELLGGIKAYGIDYRIIQEPNGQIYYPLFMITSTKKNLDSVAIECMQLHHLWPATLNLEWYSGMVGSPEAMMLGTFYFPDSNPIVIPESPPIPSGEFVNEVTIPPNSIAYFMLSEAEFNIPDDAYVGSDITLINMMPPTKFSPSLFESFITDDIGNGIISIHDGFNAFYNESVTVANVEDWYSTYDSPYISMKMDFAQDFQFSGGETFICRDGYYELNPLLNNEEHEMVMWVVKQGDSHLFANAYLDYHYAILNYNTHKAVALTNFSSETITYTPTNQVDLISVDVGVATNPNNPTPPPLLLGDANNDGVVNVLDIVNIVNYTLGTVSLTAQGAENADVNQDGEVNVLDVVTLVNQVLDNQ